MSTTEEAAADSPMAASSRRRRVVVGVDSSEPARRALAMAALEAELRNADLDVVGVWSFPTYVDPMGGVYPLPGQVDRTREREEATVKAEVERVLGRTPKVRVEVLTPSGNTASELIAAAAGAELLVVGSRGRGGFLSMLLGSTASHCVRHATCPVMVVR
jgi:nucleotide-binding universal stress UspA family protein